MLLTLCLLIVSKNNAVCFAQESIQPLAAVNKLYFRALHFYEQKNWKAAREAFQDHLSVSNHDLLFIPSMYYLAFCYQQLHDVQRSIVLYQKVIAQANTEEVFWSQMAQKRMDELSAVDQ